AGQVVEVEADVRADPALDARAREPERDRRSDGDRRRQCRLVDVAASIAWPEVADEEAVDDVRGVLARQELLQAKRVVAEAEPKCRADAAGKGADERPDDRELLPVEEVEPELRQLDRDERRRLAEDQLEDVRRLEDREVDASRLRHAGGEG